MVPVTLQNSVFSMLISVEGTVKFSCSLVRRVWEML